MSSMDTPSPRPPVDSDTEMAAFPKEFMDEIQKLSSNGMDIDIDDVKKAALMELTERSEEIVSVPEEEQEEVSFLYISDLIIL